MCLHPQKPRSIAELKALPQAAWGAVPEWLVAQEIWRQGAIAGKAWTHMNSWQSKEHEVDFVLSEERFGRVVGGQGACGASRRSVNS